MSMVTIRSYFFFIYLSISFIEAKRKWCQEKVLLNRWLIWNRLNRIISNDFIPMLFRRRSLDFLKRHNIIKFHIKKDILIFKILLIIIKKLRFRIIIKYFLPTLSIYWIFKYCNYLFATPTIFVIELPRISPLVPYPPLLKVECNNDPFAKYSYHIILLSFQKHDLETLYDAYYNPPGLIELLLWSIQEHLHKPTRFQGLLLLFLEWSKVHMHHWNLEPSFYAHLVLILQFR